MTLNGLPLLLVVWVVLLMVLGGSAAVLGGSAGVLGASAGGFGGSARGCGQLKNWWWRHPTKSTTCVSRIHRDTPLCTGSLCATLPSTLPHQAHSLLLVAKMFTCCACDPMVSQYMNGEAMHRRLQKQTQR